MLERNELLRLRFVLLILLLPTIKMFGQTKFSEFQQGVYKLSTLENTYGEERAPYDAYIICCGSNDKVFSVQIKDDYFFLSKHKIDKFQFNENKSDDMLNMSFRFWNKYNIRWSWNSSLPTDWYTVKCNFNNISKVGKLVLDALMGGIGSDKSKPIIGSWKIVGEIPSSQCTDYKRVRSAMTSVVNKYVCLSSSGEIVSFKYDNETTDFFIGSNIIQDNNILGKTNGKITRCNYGKDVINMETNKNNDAGTDKKTLKWFTDDCVAVGTNLQTCEIWERLPDEFPVISLVDNDTKAACVAYSKQCEKLTTIQSMQKLLLRESNIEALSAEENKRFYLYNTNAKGFLVGGNKWNTQASIARDHANIVVLKKYYNNGIWDGETFYITDYVQTGDFRGILGNVFIDTKDNCVYVDQKSLVSTALWRITESKAGRHRYIIQPKYDQSGHLSSFENNNTMPIVGLNYGNYILDINGHPEGEWCFVSPGDAEKSIAIINSQSDEDFEKLVSGELNKTLPNMQQKMADEVSKKLAIAENNMQELEDSRKKAEEEARLKAIEEQEKKRQEYEANQRQLVEANVDIDIPKTNNYCSSTYCVIIANENYKRMPPVEYAIHDGETFGQYCIMTLGIPEKQVKIYKDATFGEIEAAISGLEKFAQIDKNARLILYYSGHGMPDEKDGTPYLLPSDVTTTGISLKNIYEKLGKIHAESVTVLLDACFTGMQRSSEKNELAIIPARSVAKAPKKETLTGNLVVFTAASNDETAMAYKEKQHGMFTFFLLSKLKQTKGNIKYGDLFESVEQLVKKQSFINNEKLQTPTHDESPAMKSKWKDLIF